MVGKEVTGMLFHLVFSKKIGTGSAVLDLFSLKNIHDVDVVFLGQNKIQEMS